MKVKPWHAQEAAVPSIQRCVYRFSKIFKLKR